MMHRPVKVKEDSSDYMGSSYLPSGANTCSVEQLRLAYFVVQISKMLGVYEASC